MTRTNGTLRYLTSLAVVFVIGSTRLATADPIAFSANEDGSSITVVDVNAGAVRSTISLTDGFYREPRDIAIDSNSGRVFVAADGQLISFDGRVPDGRGMTRTPARADGTSVAIDEAGRRVFMTYKDLGNSYGTVAEFSISNAAAPTLTADRQVSGLPDLRLVAWDARYRRLYVVEDDGRIARTGQGNMSFSVVRGAGGGPGGILVDPSGGVWVTIRNSTNGRLVRVPESGTATETTLTGYAQPRGMAWDVGVSGTILIALDASSGRVLRFTPSTGAISTAMNTDPLTQDVGVTPGGVRVSVNRKADGMNGSMTKNGAALAATGVKPVAIAVSELLRLTAVPASKAFCYNRVGDTAEQTFTIQNTRVDRASMDLLPVTFGGLNPANYQLVGTNTCSSARLAWGQSCSFRVRFTASGPSNEPPPLFGTLKSASWPAEVVVSGTGGSGTTRIPVRGALALNSCYQLPPLIIVNPTPIFTFP